MASSNTLKNTILALFQDNVDNEISAADMRTFIEAIFEKEETIIKIATEADLVPNNTNIYEGTLVAIYNEPTNQGLWLSTVNQPTLISELIKL